MNNGDKKPQKDDGQLADPTKRDTLKSIRDIAYIAPATIILLTADRASAISIPV